MDQFIQLVDKIPHLLRFVATKPSVPTLLLLLLVHSHRVVVSADDRCYSPRMSTITLEYPSAWLAAMGLDAARFANEARVASAMKLFECGRLSSGQAAQFASMSRAEFLLSCRQWGVASVQWDDAELDAEFSSELRHAAP